MDPKLYRIFRLRIDSGYTQAEIARVLGISRPMYSYLENGRISLHVWHVILLARFYNVSSDYILCLTDIRNK